jgi:N-acetyl-anhydromuramyl-L-alanine amidase AmpD
MLDRNGHKDGEIVQANELAHITWHTKGQNAAGVGIMLEGNFKGVGHEFGEEGPTEKQKKSLDKLVGYLLESLRLSNQDVYGHYHFGKPACPGEAASGWIEGFRNRMGDQLSNSVSITKTEELQEKLNKLGYDCGKVDGIIGPKTTLAIKNFQRDFQLIVDGIPGPQTRRRLASATQ